MITGSGSGESSLPQNLRSGQKDEGQCQVDPGSLGDAHPSIASREGILRRCRGHWTLTPAHQPKACMDSIWGAGAGCHLTNTEESARRSSSDMFEKWTPNP
jgi:hypothetical protein